jgi:hypothetical protein
MGRGQPACQEERKMCRKKKRIVMPMWYIYMCEHLSCSVVVMFTCTLVRSHPDSRRRWVWNSTRHNKQQDNGLGVATRCMLIGRGQNGVQFKPGTRPWRTYSRGASRKQLFKYVQLLVCAYHLVMSCIHVTYRNFLHSGNLIRNTNWCIFFAG